jgi:hypothetical protein
MNVLRTFIIVFFCLTALISVGCGKNETETLPQKGKFYYPLNLGKEMVYDVDSIIYDPQPNGFIQIDTYKWQIKEVLKDTFKDNTGLTQYQVERYSRFRGSQNWTLENVVTSALTEQYALRTENNLRYIKFPTVLGINSKWDGNVFIDPAVKILVAGESIELFSSKWTYQVESLDKAEKIGDKSFENVMTVLAQTNPNILNEKRYTLEKYAKDIGMIYREQKILDTQKLDAAVAWEKRAEKGFILVQKVVSF